MSDGEVAAALDKIRGRWAQVEHVVLKPEVVPEPGPIPSWLPDVGRLLAALDEVLKLADGWEPIPSATYGYVAEQLRMAISHALLGEDGGDE